MQDAGNRQTCQLGKAMAALAAILVMAAGCGPRPVSDEAAVKVKFASEELDGDFMTVWANRFADQMRTDTDGRFDVSVYPSGTLGDTRDINELAQLGVIEFVFSDSAWISSFVPEAQVLLLHYVWPRERIGEVMDWVVRHGETLPLLEQAFRRNGLVPLGLFYEGWQWLTAKRPVATLDEMQGLKVRVMGSRLLIENYRAYGAAPTPMAYGEVYSSLQMGLIDAQINPIFAIRSMKFYEVQDHFTQLWAEPFTGIPTVNAAFFDRLSPKRQRQIRNWWREAVIPSAAWIEARNREELAAMRAERPQIQVTELEAEAAKAWHERSLAVRDVFLKEGGPGAQRVLDALLADIRNARQALGMAAP